MSSFMPELIMKNAADRAIREMCVEVCIRAIEKCSRIYGFDSSEAIEKLDLESLCVVSKRVKDKKVNVKKNDVVGPSFHLPFCGVKIEGRCEGIRSNWTLLTQCMKVPSNGILCKSCEKEGEKNASGEPNFGLITKRIEMGDDFADPKGRKPTHYSKYMEKHSLTEEAVIAEASKYGIVVDHSYLITPTAHKNTKKNESKVGRPQKERIPIEVNENAKPDLLEEAERLQSIEEEEEDTEVPVSPPVSAPAPAIVPVKETKEQKEVPVKKTKEQKEVPVKKTKEQKEAEKEAEKQRKEAEKEAEKQRKEAEKQAEKERKKAEKKTEKKAEKKTEKKTTVKKTKESVIEPEYVITDELTREPYDENSNSNEDEDEEQEVVSVKKIIVEGVEYFWDTNSNEVYDKDTQNVIGMYINDELVFNSDGNDDVNKVESENEDEEDEDEDEDD
jgi:hypothetical protein